MEARLQKWGNSFGIRIPKSILEDLKIEANDLLELKVEDDRVVITKSVNKKISLKEKFENFNGVYTDDFCWDDKVGNEIW